MMKAPFVPPMEDSNGGLLSIHDEGDQESLVDSSADKSTSTFGGSSARAAGASKKDKEPSASTSTKSFSEKAGDMIWRLLIVVLLSLIGSAAGFAFLYGLLTRDTLVTEKVRGRNVCVS